MIFPVKPSAGESFEMPDAPDEYAFACLRLAAIGGSNAAFPGRGEKVKSRRPVMVAFRDDHSVKEVRVVSTRKFREAAR